MKNDDPLSTYKIKNGNTVHMVKSAASNPAPAARLVVVLHLRPRRRARQHERRHRQRHPRRPDGRSLRRTSTSLLGRRLVLTVG